MKTNSDLSFTLYEILKEFLLVRLENVKAHLKLSFVRDKYIPLKRAGAGPGFQVRGGGAHLKKLRRAEGGAKLFGVFRVKNHDFTTKKIIFFPILGGARAGCAPPPPLDPPLKRIHTIVKRTF